MKTLRRLVSARAPGRVAPVGSWPRSAARRRRRATSCRTPASRTATTPGTRWSALPGRSAFEVSGDRSSFAASTASTSTSFRRPSPPSGRGLRRGAGRLHEPGLPEYVSGYYRVENWLKGTPSSSTCSSSSSSSTRTQRPARRRTPRSATFSPAQPLSPSASTTLSSSSSTKDGAGDGAVGALRTQRAGGLSAGVGRPAEGCYVRADLLRGALRLADRHSAADRRRRLLRRPLRRLEGGRAGQLAKRSAAAPASRSRCAGRRAECAPLP